MLKTYVLPRLSFPLQQHRFSKGVLRDLDNVVKKHVKAWFKLPQSTCNIVLHEESANGGLGVPRLSKQVPAQWINLLCQIGNSSDPKIRKLSQTMGCEEKIRRISEEEELKVPSSLMRRVSWRKTLVGEADSLRSQFDGHASWTHRSANDWLSGRGCAYFTESDFITSVQLRAGTYPTRTALARGRQGMGVLCQVWC